MKRIFILLSLVVFALSVCHAQVDNKFDASSLNNELDSITEIILSGKINFQFANIDYTPNDKDVDRCIELYAIQVFLNMSNSCLILRKANVQRSIYRYFSKK